MDKRGREIAFSNTDARGRRYALGSEGYRGGLTVTILVLCEKRLVTIFDEPRRSAEARHRNRGR